MLSEKEIRYYKTGIVDTEYSKYRRDVARLERGSALPEVDSKRQTAITGTWINPGLDSLCRRRVRDLIDSKCKYEWPRCWRAVYRLDREALLLDCVDYIESKWEDGDDPLYYSEDAVAREIDFYLPKAYFYFKVYRKSHPASSISGMGVLPTWPSFNEHSGWVFEFPETPDLLSIEYKNNWKIRKAC